MNERIKDLRKKLEITQQEMADRLGLKRNTIATYEMGKAVPSDRTIADICREFSVNEIWLRTGEGEMFIQKNRNQQITDFLGDLIKEEDGAFKKRFIEAMSKLDRRDWEDIERLVNKLTEKD